MTKCQFNRGLISNGRPISPYQHAHIRVTHSVSLACNAQDSCPLSLLIDVRALRCISALQDVPMLVCICPFCKKHWASPTSCTIQAEHIDYTAHGGRMKAGGGGAWGFL